MATMETKGSTASPAARPGEPDWLVEFRSRAREVFADTPPPHRAQHLWRYTDPELFEPAAGATARITDEVVPASLPEEARRAGVTLVDLATAAREQPERLQRVFGRLIGPAFGRFEAWNGAAFGGGYFLHVPRGVELATPIHLQHRLTEGPLAAVRVAVLLEEGSSATLVEEWSGGATAGLQQLYSVGELEVGPNARLRHVTLQELASRTRALLTQRARLDRGASFVPVIASFGGALVKTDTGAILEGEGAESEMAGFLSAIGKRKFDHHTLHHHIGRHTRSNLDYKTVLKDRARSAYTGLIRIEPEAAHSSAYQENRNLLLSDHCRADSIPELEILTEEVQCTHGATVGPVDPDHLFYLRSRAIPESEAVRMIVEGHFEPTLRRLPESLQERLRETLREKVA